MREASPARQKFTLATVPLRREYLRQPALLAPLFPGKLYELPKVTEGQEALVYDADEWQRYNGRRGTVTHYSYFTGLHTIVIEGRYGTYERQFYGREIMNVR